jgi:hypothetical protein
MNNVIKGPWPSKSSQARVAASQDFPTATAGGSFFNADWPLLVNGSRPSQSPGWSLLMATAT